MPLKSKNVRHAWYPEKKISTGNLADFFLLSLLSVKNFEKNRGGF
jgi:hypothetical protein